MDHQEHYSMLERLYQQAPIVQSIFSGSRIQVQNGFATIEWVIDARFHHGAGSLHGSAYFRLLDDAAYFAASSQEKDWFLLTADFELKFLRPVSQGLLRAEGRFSGAADSKLLLAEATLFNEAGKVVARGKGRFARSKHPFNSGGSPLYA